MVVAVDSSSVTLRGRSNNRDERRELLEYNGKTENFPAPIKYHKAIYFLFTHSFINGCLQPCEVLPALLGAF